jgi:hypothetical protein
MDLNRRTVLEQKLSGINQHVDRNPYSGLSIRMPPSLPQKPLTGLQEFNPNKGAIASNTANANSNNPRHTQSTSGMNVVKIRIKRGFQKNKVEKVLAKPNDLGNNDILKITTQKSEKLIRPPNKLISSSNKDIYSTIQPSSTKSSTLVNNNHQYSITGAQNFANITGSLFTSNLSNIHEANTILKNNNPNVNNIKANRRDTTLSTQKIENSLSSQLNLEYTQLNKKDMNNELILSHIETKTAKANNFFRLNSEEDLVEPDRSISVREMRCFIINFMRMRRLYLI